MTNHVKVKHLIEFLKANKEKINSYEAIEKEIELNRWLLEVYTEASSVQEFQNIFNREISTIKFNLQKLITQYTENKSEYEKNRLILQNTAIKKFIKNRFGVVVNNDNYDDIPEIIEEISQQGNVKSNKDSNIIARYSPEKEKPQYLQDIIPPPYHKDKAITHSMDSEKSSDKKTVVQIPPPPSQDLPKNSPAPDSQPRDRKGSHITNENLTKVETDEVTSRTEIFSRKLNKYNITFSKNEESYEINKALISAEEELSNLIGDEYSEEQSLYSILSEDENDLLAIPSPAATPIDTKPNINFKKAAEKNDKDKDKDKDKNKNKNKHKKNKKKRN